MRVCCSDSARPERAVDEASGRRHRGGRAEQDWDGFWGEYARVAGKVMCGAVGGEAVRKLSASLLASVPAPVCPARLGAQSAGTPWRNPVGHIYFHMVFFLVVAGLCF